MGNPVTEISSQPLVNPSKADTYDLLKDDKADGIKPEGEDLLKVDEKKEVVDDEKKEKKEEKEEIEIEDEEGDVNDEAKFAAPVRRQVILKEYPDLFKKFPFIESAIYKSKEFGELFGTVEDAKELVERNKNFEKFEEAAFSGDLSPILKAVATEDADNFGNLVDNYLPSLYKVNQEAYHTVIGNLFSDVVARMYKQGKASENEALQQAAAILNQFAFGTTDYREPKNFGKGVDKGDDKKQKEFETEREKFFQERLETVTNDLESRVTNSIRSTINNNIDPKGLMSEYIKKTAIADCYGEVEQKLANDKDYQRMKDKLWEKAASNNFSNDSVEEIRKLHLTRVKLLLPSALQRARNEALRGMGKKVKEEEQEVRRPAPSSNSRSSNDDKPKRRMSTFEMLNED